MQHWRNDEQKTSVKANMLMSDAATHRQLRSNYAASKEWKYLTNERKPSSGIISNGTTDLGFIAIPPLRHKKIYFFQLNNLTSFFAGFSCSDLIFAVFSPPILF